METKVIKPIKVLYFSQRLSLNELAQYVRFKAKELYADAYECGMEVTGPIYWLYEGMDGKPDTVFNLEIALPVFTECKSGNKFKIKELPEFKCLSHIHNGAWVNFPESYNQVVGHIFSNGLQMTGVSREVYLNIDFIDFDRNITEIQMGIQ